MLEFRQIITNTLRMPAGNDSARVTRHLYQVGDRDTEVEMALTRPNWPSCAVAAYGLIGELSRGACANLSSMCDLPSCGRGARPGEVSHELVGVVRLLVTVRLLPFRQLYLLAANFLVGDVAE